MLKGLNAPLRRIRLDFERTRDHSIKFMDPFPVLNNFRHTLVKVCMVGFEWDRTAMIPDATFPNVRFLSIRTGSYQTVHIVALMVAFPNVRVFHISNFYGALEDDELEIVREMNIEDQGTIDQRWEHLDVVKGDPCSLYEMGLKMKVSKVRLLLIIPEEYKCCHRLLVDTKPRHLQIRWPQESSHSDFADPREEVLGMFTFEGLDFLSIHFNFFRKTSEDINKFMDAFLKLLRSSKLRYLHIKIIFESVYSHNFEPQPQLQPVGDMENELKAWRGKAIDEISSLQMIIFQIKQQSEKFEAWRTTNLREPGETCSLEKVTKNECKRLIGKEGYRVEKWRYNRIDLSLDPES
ncbi:hypothetical protein C8Q75DRAFT_770248 [Abortiporus biennis]|nr:hypothetical protein C8Q75DRAFT_770248 [Abortiporus biennis]